jgi:hypothetical protein
MATIIGKIVPNITERRGITGTASKEMSRPKNDAIWNALKQINRT